MDILLTFTGFHDPCSKEVDMAEWKGGFFSVVWPDNRPWRTMITRYRRDTGYS